MTLADQLAQLETAGLIRLRAALPELEYIFRHALTRDAAYTSLLHSQRKAVHRAAGEALEAMCGTPALRVSAAPVLAEHLAQAGEPARALDFWELAADHALAQYALPEAIAHLGRALELARLVPGLPPARLQALYLKRGKAQYSNTEWFASWETHTALLALADRLDDDHLRLAALLELASQRVVMNPLRDPAEAQVQSQRALELAQRLGDKAAEAKAWWTRMGAHSQTQENALALAAGEQSLALARAEGLAEQAAYTLNDLHYVYRALGQDAQALELLAEARAHWRAQRHQHMLADNLNMTAMAALTLGDYAAAEQAAQEALALSLPTQNVAQQFLGRSNLAAVHLEQGRFAQALAELDAVQMDAADFFALSIQLRRSYLLDALGRRPEAIAVLRQGLVVGPTQGFAVIFRYGLVGHLAYLLAQAGQLAEAEAALRDAQALLPVVSRWSFVNYGYDAPLVEAVIALARHDWAAAQTALAPFIATLSASGPVTPLSEAQRLYGQALAGAGSPEAEVMLTQAVETAERYGQRPAAWRAWQALAAWQHHHGQPAAAADSLQRARAHLRWIMNDLPGADARATFLDLPDVRSVLNSAS